MRRAALAAFLLAVLAASAAHGEPAIPQTALVRTAITVADADRAKRFYTEAFGYRVRFDGEIAKPENRVLLGLPASAKVRFIIVDGPRAFAGKTREATGIGLLQRTDARMARFARPRGNALAVGEAMLALETDDLDAVLARLRRLGAPILAGPVIGHGGAEREIVTRDPDGTRIHVVEQRPAQSAH
jgi:catechol 2,3-dioxygenase-like lactoylglutathione lyase family enzyme